jgi:hypothetical protein
MEAMSNVIDLEAFRARTRGDKKSAESLFVGAHQREYGDGAEDLFQRIFGPTSMTFEEWCQGADSLM